MKNIQPILDKLKNKTKLLTIKKMTETKTKFYTTEYVSKKYASLSLKEKNEVLYEAIDYMNQYNGRSRFLCIAMAMGFDNDEGNENSYYKRS